MNVACSGRTRLCLIVCSQGLEARGRTRVDCVNCVSCPSQSSFWRYLMARPVALCSCEPGCEKALMQCATTWSYSWRYYPLTLIVWYLHPLSHYTIHQHTTSSLTQPRHTTTLPPSLHPIHLSRIRNLRPRLLPSHRQPHRMSPSPITAHIPQPLNIRPDLPPQIILNRQSTQFINQTIQLRQRQLAQFRVRVDVVGC